MIWILKFFVKNKVLYKVEFVIFSALWNKIIKVIESGKYEGKIWEI